MGGVSGADTTVVISNCLNEGNIQAGSQAAGLVGCLWGKSVLKDSINKGIVSGNGCDPICANKESGNITNCQNLS